MGGGGAIGGLVGGGPGALLGGAFGGQIGKTLGLSGEQGRYFQSRDIPELQSGAYSAQMGDTRATEMMNPVQQALLRGESVNNGALSDLTAPQLRATAESPIAGQRLAAQEVINSPLAGGVYGDKGLQGSLQKEYQTYEGGGLTPEYQNELDKAMGNITRQYGGTEQSLAQALASRGLGAAPSGSAGVEYTGLMGSKNEQLAGAQMQAALNKLQAKRQLGQQMAALASQAGQAGNSQFAGQLAGVGSARDQMARSAATENAQNQAMLSREGLIAGQNQAEIGQQHEYKAPSLGEAFGAGLMSSATQFGAAPGTFASSFAGGAGKGAAGTKPPGIQ